MKNNILERVLFAVDSWLGTGAKVKLVRSMHPELLRGEKLNLAQMYAQMNIPFFNTLRILAVLVLFPVTGIFLLDAYAVEPTVPMRLLFMCCVLGASVLVWRAVAIRFSRVEFQKPPQNDALHSFLSGTAGKQRLRRWGDESAEIHRFIVANNIHEEFSTFEYELIESFRHEQTYMNSPK